GPRHRAAENPVEQTLRGPANVADREVTDTLDEPADDPAEREVPREPRDHTAAREREPFPADRVGARQPAAHTFDAAPAGDVVGLDHEALADRLGELGPENALTRADGGNEGVDAGAVARHDTAARKGRDLREARLDARDTRDLVDQADDPVVVEPDHEVDRDAGDVLQPVPDPLDAADGGREGGPHPADTFTEPVERRPDAVVPDAGDGRSQPNSRLPCASAKFREPGAEVTRNEVAQRIEDPRPHERPGIVDRRAD